MIGNTSHNCFQTFKFSLSMFRLRHNVIKAGVRMINLSYSRISLVDIAHKLQLDSPEDAEFIVAKVLYVKQYTCFVQGDSSMFVSL